ncbi:hypothetical protein Dacet_2245 [Denitrovibrio acetiphilus DSM 12809]|uniref:Uncharacterized protein n=1 Tax=Denitrovibrio acetiphilus (strain DSM 12809 / NBRC 114555 / N2460) TaxID=522772 RepID=D4H2Y4_DENA2|nr:hypothetical protein [Denitrovibrio acetiphilus]ADD69007.1 hypothetical protein Dacet_2245 [Denitrovibrio acetiphilus DSM 12809]
MADKIANKNTFAPVDQIGYMQGKVLRVDFEKDLLDVEINGMTYKGIPSFYNCPASGDVRRDGSLTGSSAAFTRGDDVVVRMFNKAPSHVTGFTADMWPCVKTPAFIFTQTETYAYDIQTETFSAPMPERFSDRYMGLDKKPCAAERTSYINDDNAQLSDGFVIIEQDWTDERWNRDTRFYYGSELVYQTYNNETFNNVFNGTRSNIFGTFIQPDTLWGCMVYQVNTFYDWKPSVSGRVTADYYIYSSAGLHTKIASAECIVSGQSSEADGEVVENVSCHSLYDQYAGEMLVVDISVFKADSFSSDGSTNKVESSDMNRRAFLLITEGTDEPDCKVFSIKNDSSISQGDYGIFVKSR